MNVEVAVNGPVKKRASYLWGVSCQKSWSVWLRAHRWRRKLLQAGPVKKGSEEGGRNTDWILKKHKNKKRAFRYKGTCRTIESLC